MKKVILIQKLIRGRLTRKKYFVNYPYRTRDSESKSNSVKYNNLDMINSAGIISNGANSYRNNSHKDNNLNTSRKVISESQEKANNYLEEIVSQKYIYINCIYFIFYLIYSQNQNLNK